jgi:hypothetical protein
MSDNSGSSFLHVSPKIGSNWGILLANNLGRRQKGKVVPVLN